MIWENAKNWWQPNHQPVGGWGWLLMIGGVDSQRNISSKRLWIDTWYITWSRDSPVLVGKLWQEEHGRLPAAVFLQAAIVLGSFQSVVRVFGFLSPQLLYVKYIYICICTYLNKLLYIPNTLGYQPRVRDRCSRTMEELHNLLTCIDRCIVGDDVWLQVLIAQCQPQSRSANGQPQMFINGVFQQLYTVELLSP